MTVRGEPEARLRVRFGEVGDAARAKVVEQFVVAAPPDEVGRIRPLLPTAPGLRASVVVNPSGRRSPGLNRALAACDTDHVARLDARSTLEVDHLRAFVAALDDAAVGLAGGRQRPQPADGRLISRGIARALANPLALGNAAYRRSASGPVDTVYLGAFRREELLGLGGWDEDLMANEDFDLCRRYQRAGYHVVLTDADIGYEARSSVRDLWDQYRAFGEAKALVWRTRRSAPAPRQLVALTMAPLGAALAAAALIRSRRRAMVVGLGCAGLLGLDAAAHAVGTPGERVVAAMLYPVIWAAWLGGVGTGLVRR